MFCGFQLSFRRFLGFYRKKKRYRARSDDFAYGHAEKRSDRSRSRSARGENPSEPKSDKKLDGLLDELAQRRREKVSFALKVTAKPRQNGCEYERGRDGEVCRSSGGVALNGGEKRRKRRKNRSEHKPDRARYPNYYRREPFGFVVGGDKAAYGDRKPAACERKKQRVHGRCELIHSRSLIAYYRNERQSVQSSERFADERARRKRTRTAHYSFQFPFHEVSMPASAKNYRGGEPPRGAEPARASIWFIRVAWFYSCCGGFLD